MLNVVTKRFFNNNGGLSSVVFSLEKLGRAGVSLKPEQKLAVKAIFEGKDTFLCLPTGYGKSLCYQTLLDF